MCEILNKVQARELVKHEIAHEKERENLPYAKTLPSWVVTLVLVYANVLPISFWFSQRSKAWDTAEDIPMATTSDCKRIV